MSHRNNPPPPHDPYPMTSEQAKALEESVSRVGAATGDVTTATAVPQSGSWQHMAMSSNTSTSPSGEMAAGDGDYLVEQQEETQQILMSVGGKKKRSTTTTSTNDGDNDVEDCYYHYDKHAGDDTFLDRPLEEFRGGKWQRRFAVVTRLTEQVYHRLYGDDLPVSEMVRTLTLASTLFFMIGGYWTLRSLKDPVLTALCGVAVIPKAKMLSVVVVLGVVSIYNAFLDSDIPKHQLFYLFGTFYFGLFTCISLLLLHPTIGLANQQAHPTRILGWISYCSIESFGSVMVSLFWSFANSNFSLKEAKASYGVMVAAAQVGSIIGPTLVNRFAEKWGVAHCYLLGASCMLWLQLSMRTYVTMFGTDERNTTTINSSSSKQEPIVSPKEPRAKTSNTATTTSKTTAAAAPPLPKKKKAGVLEGLKLFVKYNYVKGIFAISCLFMVEVTIVDFTMKVLARDFFAQEHPCQIGQSCWDASAAMNHGMSEQATAAFTKFMGFFGQATNTLSLIMSLFGTSAVIRYLGLRLTLLLFPTLCLAVICAVRFHPTLYVVFAAMIALKAFSYSLNNPTKEMLYQPTSAAVRYKAKSWIDIFGARGSKALGSVVTNAFSDNTTHLVNNGSLVGMAVASFLIWNARFMGKLFDEYTASDYIVGEDDDKDPAAVEAVNVEKASHQNDLEDTSCAIPSEDDDDEEEEDSEEVDGHEKPQVTMV